MAGSGKLSFITEKEVEDVKKKRQDDWERVRSAKDPIGAIKTTSIEYHGVVCVVSTERPEESCDARSLYDRLKEQKDLVQEKWDEQFQFSKWP